MEIRVHCTGLDGVFFFNSFRCLQSFYFSFSALSISAFALVATVTLVSEFNSLIQQMLRIMKGCYSLDKPFFILVCVNKALPRRKGH